jgi:putative toxin-antitoxin system antitoxin component (TIGR02293 family)
LDTGWQVLASASTCHLFLAGLGIVRRKSVILPHKKILAMFGTSENYEGLSDVLNATGISKDPVRTDWELHNLTEKRLQKSSLVVVAKQLGLTVPNILKAIDLDKKQYAEMKDDDLLSIRNSEHLLKMMELVSRGIDLWGKNLDSFKRWVKSPIDALNGKRPADFLDTFVGIDMVIAIIGRIEHGVYS